MDTQPPLILLVDANDRIDPSRHLRNLSDEIRRIRDALRPAEQAKHCRVLWEPNASAERIFAVFQDADFRNRIAILHYAGHADEYRLLMESASGGASPAQAAGLAAFLGEQRGLALVFLNGCSTEPQAQGLIEANCPAVIATSQTIDNQVAMDFAERFYAGLAGGAGLESAFKQATAAVRTTRGETPRALYWGGAMEPVSVDDRWPWDIRFKPGADKAPYWNLPEAADDPLFQLPALPRLELPESPFRHLAWFDREHAEVFFGRPVQIREIFNRITDPDARPILLFYGQSGVGKSSVLAAGLLPRLEFSHSVHYLRRKAQLGLLGTLMEALDAAFGELGAAWHKAEAKAGRPLLVILDQIEEVFTRPDADRPAELETFLNGLDAIFGCPAKRPQGRLILSFRKEWMPEIDARLAERHLPRGYLFLEGLDRAGVIAAVSGASRSERLCTAYGLQIDQGLAEEIADDLLADPDSPIAPTLQILLTKLWDEARHQNRSQPRFTRSLYLKLKREGFLLKDFLDHQLADLEQWRPLIVQSGLALDLLAFHTTPKGTAAERHERELLETYTHVEDGLRDIVQRCKDTYLLTDAADSQEGSLIKGTRLAHDTLAVLVREQFDESDKPGQRARRIVESRAAEWRNGATGAVLDETDLEVVETGSGGMRHWTSDERRLVNASRRARERQQRRRQRLKAMTWIGLTVVVGAGLFAGWQWWRAEQQRQVAEEQQHQAEQQKKAAERQERIATARMQASQAQVIADTYPERALLLAAEAIKRPLEADGIRLGGVETALRSLLGATGGRRLAECADFSIEPLAFDHQGHWLAAGNMSDAACLWDLQNPTARPTLLRGHMGNVENLAFDPLGRWLATTDLMGEVRLWDLRNPVVEPTVLPEKGYATSDLAFDPSGHWLATGDSSGNVRVWDLLNLTAKPTVLLGNEDEVVDRLIFDSRGRWLATCAQSSRSARLWNVANFAAKPVVLSGHKDAITAMAMDPQGRWLATDSGDKTARIWNLDRPSDKPLVLEVPEHGGSYLAFSPRGRWLATPGRGTAVRLWDLKNPAAEPTELPGIDDWATHLTFDPKGRWLATAGSGHQPGHRWDLGLWDLRNPSAKPVVLRAHEGEVTTLAVDPQGRWFATGSSDGSLRLWDIASPPAEPLILRAHLGVVSTLAFDSRGRWLATGSLDHTARLWDLQNLAAGPQVLSGHENIVNILAFDPKGRWLATGSDDRTARLWDIENPTTEPVILRGHDSVVNVLAFDPQGRRLATGSDDGTVRLWNLRDPAAEPTVLRGHEVEEVKTLAFSREGQWLATGSSDGTVRLWNLRDAAAEPTVLRGHEDSVKTLAFDPQGRWLATGGVDRTVRLWDLQNLKSDPVLLPGEKYWVVNLIFDPSGRWLATAGMDNTAHLWDLENLQAEPTVLRGHEGGVWPIAFDPQGRWLATGSEDSTARLWDLKNPAAEPVVLRGHDGKVGILAFDPEGRWLATGSDDGTARLWQLDINGLLKRVCRTAGRNFTRAEWRQHVGDLDYRMTCSDLPSDGESRNAPAPN
jgi:WD40 repeat protein